MNFGVTEVDSNAKCICKLIWGMVLQPYLLWVYSWRWRHRFKSTNGIKSEGFPGVRKWIYLDVEAVGNRVLGGGIGEVLLMTELKASSKTSSGLLGLNSKGVSRSTLPESTRESRILVPEVAEDPGIRLLAGVGVSIPNPSSSDPIWEF